jgi:hypothetical protein
MCFLGSWKWMHDLMKHDQRLNREFPHTDHWKFQQITDLLVNVSICPAAFNIVEAMKKKLPL